MRREICLFVLILSSVIFFFVVVPAQAADLSKAKDTVNRIRQPDPPQQSTTTIKTSPLGQPTTSYHPAGPSVHPVAVPSPVNRNNPTNDPDVQRGFDAHQKAHGR
jgi:hypothetical protein